MRRFNRSAGFSLIELIITMTIGMLVMAGGYLAYSGRDADAKVRMTVEATATMMRDAEMLTSNRMDYRIANTDGSLRLITANDLAALRVADMPSGLSVSGGAVRTSWGGVMTVTSESSTGTAHDLLRVQLTEVPQKICLRLLSGMSRSVYDMYVGGNLVGLWPPVAAEARGRDQVRTDQAGTLCAAAATSTIVLRRLKEINYTAMRRTPFDTLSTAEQTRLDPAYARVEAAMTARETAQLAIP